MITIPTIKVCFFVPKNKASYIHFKSICRLFDVEVLSHDSSYDYYYLDVETSQATLTAIKRSTNAKYKTEEELKHALRRTNSVYQNR